MNYLDIFAQCVIVLAGIFSVYLMSSSEAEKRMYGSFTGLLGEPFWFMTAVINFQPGVIVLVLVFGVNWIRAFLVSKRLVANEGKSFSFFVYAKILKETAIAMKRDIYSALKINKRTK